MNAVASLAVGVAPDHGRADARAVVPFRHGPSALERIESENEMLRERLKAFEQDFLGDDMIFPTEWRLTLSEKRIFGALVARSQVTRQQLLTAVTRYVGEEPEIKIVDVFICKLRKKLAPLGIRIETIWGFGYFIGQAKRLELRARLSTNYRIEIPAVTTPAIDEVLSLPFEQIRPLCALYRAAGFTIGASVEDEQSFIVFRFLPLAIRFGDGWKPQAHADVCGLYLRVTAGGEGAVRQIAGPA